MPERRVDFLIIGAAKCATTWLQRSLQRSPDIFMPDPELHFFSREYQRGLDWYLEQFADAPAGVTIGEKSNTYLSDPAAAARIHSTFPDVKLIVQMRDPVARAYSDYCMLLRRGEVSRDITAHLDPAKASGERFIDHGCYAHHLERFLELYPRDRILLLQFEDIRRDPIRQLARLREHIGQGPPLAAPLDDKVKDKETPLVPLGLRRVLKPMRPALDKVRDTQVVQTLRNAVARPVEYPALTDDLATRMHEYFREDVARMELLMGQTLDGWSLGAKAQAR